MTFILFQEYGCEGIEVRNNVSYRNFLRFENDFELKIWEVKVCF
jgi:hypothetical protein